MDQIIFASLSHTHYWYEVGMLKVPVFHIASRLKLTIDTINNENEHLQTREGVKHLHPSIAACTRKAQE